MKKIIYSTTALFLGFLASSVHAQGPISDGANQLPNPLAPSGVNTLSDLLVKIIGYLNLVAAPVITGMVLYGGFQMLFAQDNVKKFEDGIKTIKHAAMGAGVVIIADGVLYVIKEILTQ